MFSNAETWSLKYNKTGASLATVSGTTGSPFTPSSTSDWEQVEVNMSNFASDEHVLVKFRNTSGEGNNVYIDDIQISGPLGIAESPVAFDFNLSPNPAEGHSILSVKVQSPGQYNIMLTDVTGKSVGNIYRGTLNTGENTFAIGSDRLNPGVYLVRVDHAGRTVIRKLIVR